MTRSWLRVVGVRLACALVVALASFLAGSKWGAGLFAISSSSPAHAGPVAASVPIPTDTPVAADPAVAAAPAAVRVLPPAGEFERQAALILGCNELVRWHPRVFADVVAAAYPTTRLIGLVGEEEELEIARKILKEQGLPAGAITFVLLPLDTMWVRDYGPLFSRRSDGAVVLVDSDYSEVDDQSDRQADNDSPKLLGELFHLPVAQAPLRLEGGNLLSNGEGICVSTTALIKRNAGHGYDLRGVGNVLSRRFGFSSWIYLKELVGEPTGHADMFVTFVAPNVAVVGQVDPEVDPANARIMDEAAALLAGEKTPLGPMQVHRIPMPPNPDGNWRSYTNVIFANRTLLVPSYSDVDGALQRKAFALYAQLLPDWKVVGIDADSLAEKRGILHCITMNVPGYVPLASLLREHSMPPVVGGEDAPRVIVSRAMRREHHDGATTRQDPHVLETWPVGVGAEPDQAEPVILPRYRFNNGSATPGN